MKFLKFNLSEGEEVWVLYNEIVAMKEFSEKGGEYCKVYLKNGIELIVEDMPENIWKTIASIDDSAGYYTVV